jgi:DNA transposition AAA+ family ATPase
MSAAELTVLQGDMFPGTMDMSGWPKERMMIYKLVKENGTKIDTIAKEINFSRPQVSRFINEDSFKMSDEFLAAVRAYLVRLGLWYDDEECTSRFKTKVSQMDFIITEAWKRTWFVLETAIKNKNFGMIVGPSGCGKTAAIHHWMDMDANFEKAVMITANGCMTRKSILRRIAKSLGIGGSADADTLIERICAELAERPRLLIFDEADQLAAEFKLEVLRSILDGARTTGIVLIGNEDLSEYILSIAVDKRKLARIHNRFGAFQQVTMPTKPEADRLLEGYNLTPGARDYLANVIRRRSGDGGIRVAKTMLAIVLEAMGDKLITEDLLRSTALKNAVLSASFHGH